MNWLSKLLLILIVCMLLLFIPIREVNSKTGEFQIIGGVMLIKAKDIILYNNEHYKVIKIDETGYCEIQKVDSPNIVELIHKKDLKECTIV